MTTHHDLETIHEKLLLARMAKGTGLPVHFVVQCESVMSAHVIAASLGSDYTIITESNRPKELECVGRRVSKPLNEQ